MSIPPSPPGATHVSKHVADASYYTQGGHGSLSMSFINETLKIHQLPIEDQGRVAIMHKAMGLALWHVEVARVGREEEGKEMLLPGVGYFLSKLRNLRSRVSYYDLFLSMYKTRCGMRYRRLQSNLVDGSGRVLVPGVVAAWVGEERVMNLLGLPEEEQKDIKSLLACVLGERMLVDDREGVSLEALMREFVHGYQQGRIDSMQARALAGFLSSLGQEDFQQKVARTYARTVKEWGTTLLKTLQQSKGHKQLDKNLWHIRVALQKCQGMVLLVVWAPFLSEVYEPFRLAWRELNRRDTAEIAEIFALAANRVLDPYRPDVPQVFHTC